MDNQEKDDKIEYEVLPDKRLEQQPISSQSDSESKMPARRLTIIALIIIFGLLSVAPLFMIGPFVCGNLLFGMLFFVNFLSFVILLAGGSDIIKKTGSFWGCIISSIIPFTLSIFGFFVYFSGPVVCLL